MNLGKVKCSRVKILTSLEMEALFQTASVFLCVVPYREGSGYFHKACVVCICCKI